MKIAVVLSNEFQEEQAGVRIRYKRIIPVLKAYGHSLELIPIQELASINQPLHDVYLVSKCYDARSLMLVKYMSERGASVGIDLFDDYFSQLTDSSFIRLRYWLRTILAHCSFILCSTVAMQEVAKSYAPQLISHVMHDPVDLFDLDVLKKVLTRKLQATKKLRRIDIAWFGMGDNPNFAVGLSDLAAFGHELDRLRGHGYEVQLSILTNLRAMTADNLALLSRLATPYTIQEWTVEREKALLDRCVLSFLPVNSQSFSRVKSMNRAFTSLINGTQVLSVGYPLYSSLNNFIYRSSMHFLNDLDQMSLALRVSTVPEFCEYVEKFSNVGVEAQGLVEFLSGANNKQSFISQVRTKNLAVIHGKDSNAEIHKFAQKKGMLSVASPFCTNKLNFDIRFEFLEDGNLLVLVSERKMNLVVTDLASLFKPHRHIVNTEYLALDAKKIFPDISVNAVALFNLGTLASLTAAYSPIMNSLISLINILFPGYDCLVSEQSKRIPWSILNSDEK